MTQLHDAKVYTTDRHEMIRSDQVSCQGLLTLKVPTQDFASPATSSKLSSNSSSLQKILHVTLRPLNSGRAQEDSEGSWLVDAAT